MELKGFTINGDGPYFAGKTLTKYLKDYGINETEFADGNDHIGTIMSKVYSQHFKGNNLLGVTRDSMVYLKGGIADKLVEKGFTTKKAIKTGRLQVVRLSLAKVILKECGVCFDVFQNLSVNITNIEFDGQMVKELPVPEKTDFPLFSKKPKWHGGKVIDEFDDVEQAIIRRYNERCKETKELRRRSK